MATEMSSVVSWVDTKKFIGTSKSGHSVAVHAGMQDEITAPNPLEMLLISLGSCAVVAVVEMLRIKEQEVYKVETKVDALRVDEEPMVFEKIDICFVVTGNNVDTTVIERGMKRSHEVYCPVSTMLERGGVEINYSYEVNQI